MANFEIPGPIYKGLVVASEFGTGAVAGTYAEVLGATPVEAGGAALAAGVAVEVARRVVNKRREQGSNDGNNNA